MNVKMIVDKLKFLQTLSLFPDIERFFLCYENLIYDEDFWNVVSLKFKSVKKYSNEEELYLMVAGGVMAVMEIMEQQDDDNFGDDEYSDEIQVVRDMGTTSLRPDMNTNDDVAEKCVGLDSGVYEIGMEVDIKHNELESLNKDPDETPENKIELENEVEGVEMDVHKGKDIIKKTLYGYMGEITIMNNMKSLYFKVLNRIGYRKLHGITVRKCYDTRRDMKKGKNYMKSKIFQEHFVGMINVEELVRRVGPWYVCRKRVRFRY